MSKNAFFISAPKNVYSSTNISYLRGLEAVTLTGTRVQFHWSQWNSFFLVVIMFLKIL